MEKNYAIVYMVAGISSRFGGRIKQFARVGPNGETLIEHSLNQALAAGFGKIIFVVGEMTEGPFREMFGDSYNGVPVCYAKQTFDVEARDKPWGTCDALCAVRGVVDCPFVVCNGDDIYGKETFGILLNHLKEETHAATIGYNVLNSLPGEGAVNRGKYSFDDEGFVSDIDEVFGIERWNLEESGLLEDDLVSMNIFALHPEMLEDLHVNLELFKSENKEDRRAECLLPVEFSNLIKAGRLRMKCHPTKEKWFGVTNPDDEDVVRKQISELS